MRTELETRYTLATVDGEGKITERKSVSEAKMQSLQEEATEKNEPAPTAEKLQVFKRYTVESIDDFLVLVQDSEEQLNIINRTLDIKQTDFMREYMTSPTLQPTGEVYDLETVCGAKSERKATSPIDKLFKGAAKLSIEEQLKLIALVQALQAATGAPTPAA